MSAADMHGATGRRSWFAVDGTLEQIDYDGPSDFRFPEAVAGHLIERYSRPGDWVLDPFCGFGTTLVTAARLNREAVGFEADAGRAAFAASRLTDPGRVVHGRAEDVEVSRWPAFALLLTSPPYGSFRDGSAVDDTAAYIEDARRIFSSLARLLAPSATVAVEVSQVRAGRATRPLVWHLGMLLSETFQLREDIVRINTGATEAGPGYDHSHVLIFGLR